MPWPSKERAETPRKSRMRGIAMLISRSRNSYMRAPRSVTLQPMGRPARILNAAIALRDLVMSGFCPVILVRSATAASITFFSATASPTPMFTVILVIRGTCIGFWMLSCSRSRGTTCSR